MGPSDLWHGRSGNCFGLADHTSDGTESVNLFGEFGEIREPQANPAAFQSVFAWQLLDFIKAWTNFDRCSSAAQAVPAVAAVAADRFAASYPVVARNRWTSWTLVRPRQGRQRDGSTNHHWIGRPSNSAVWSSVDRFDPAFGCCSGSDLVAEIARAVPAVADLLANYRHCRRSMWRRFPVRVAGCWSN